MMGIDLETLAASVIALLFAVVLHEIAHGYVANWLGDDTARVMGRLSLNPVRHVDPLGTVILPGLMLMSGTGVVFGWAKPVPVDLRNLRNPKHDMVLVAFAGPASNFLLAVLGGLALHLILGDMQEPPAYPFLLLLAVTWIKINLIIALFNMIPIPPLDGGKILIGLLPMALARPLAEMERYGMALLLLLMLAPAVLPAGTVSPLGWYMGQTLPQAFRMVLTLSGHDLGGGG